MKQIQISARSAKNDLLIKARQMDKFLEEGHRIEVVMRLRGQEKYNRERALQKLNEFLVMLAIEHKPLSEPRFGGRGVMMAVAKK